MAHNSNRKMQALRRALQAAINPRDVYEIAKLQTFLALKGDTNAANFVLDRVIGKAVTVSEMLEIEAGKETREDRIGVESEVYEMLHSVPDYPALIDGRQQSLPLPECESPASEVVESASIEDENPDDSFSESA